MVMTVMRYIGQSISDIEEILLFLVTVDWVKKRRRKIFLNKMADFENHSWSAQPNGVSVDFLTQKLIIFNFDEWKQFCTIRHFQVLPKSWKKRAKILMFFGPQKLNNKYSAESVENSRNIPTYIGDHFVQFFRSVNPNFIVIFVER